MSELALSSPLDLLQGASILQPADRNPAECYFRSLSRSGSKTMLGKVQRALRLIGWTQDVRAFAWQEFRYQHLSALKTMLSETGLSPGTINCTLAALRGIARAGFNLGQISSEDFARLATIKPVHGTTLPAGRALDHGELVALFRVCAQDPSPAGHRDAAILAILYGSGCRRSEIVDLDLSDFDPPTGELKIHGKGSRERLGYATNGSRDGLSEWLKIRGAEEGALFVPIRKDGRLSIRRMSSMGVYNLLRKRCRQAGVKACSPHDFRRTFVGDLLDAGADISSVQKLAGHASVTTTQRYDRRPEAAKRKAAELLHVPFQSCGS